MSRVDRASARSHGFRPASREQEGLWLLEQSRTIGAANNLPFALTLEGDLDPERLRRAFGRLVERQPALRTELRVSGGRLEARQLLQAPPSVELEAIEVADESEAAARAAERCRRRLDPLRWPPYRVSLVSGPDERHLLLVVAHHCVVDGGSLEPLLGDLMTLYRWLGGGPPAAAPPTGDLLSGLAEHERNVVEADVEPAEAYWPALLGAIEDTLPLPRVAQPAGGPDRVTSAEFELTASLRGGLRELAEACDTSVFTVLLAALQVLQYRYAGGGDGGVATAVAMDARSREARGVAGMFANEAPLITTPEGGIAFRAFLAQVVDRTRRMFEFRRYPFTEALARFGRGAAARSARSEVGITYLRLGRADLSAPGLEAGTARILPNGWSRRALMLWIFDEPERLGGRFDVDSTVLGRDAARRVAGHYVRLLESVVSDAGTELADIALPGPEERRRVLVEFNDSPPLTAEASCVPSLVDAQVRRSPARVAVSDAERELTYAELDTRANQLAHELRQLGAGPDAPVAVCLDRSAQLVVALLGILKAGAAYLPLDPEYPSERLLLMLDEARARLIVTLEPLADRLPSRRARFVLLDGDAEALARRPVTSPDVAITADDLAYVIFTSGSTGVPKGVAMPHRAPVNLLCWQQARFRTCSGVRTLQFASPSFDVAFQEIFSTLATGGTLLPVDQDTRRDLARLAAFIERERPRRAFLPFLVLSELASRSGDRLSEPAELDVITAGERLEITPAVRALFAARPGWTLTNQYGPTETHVVTSHRLTGSPDAWPALPPIGRPIANARAYVLHDRLHPTPVGVPGELCLGGRCLALGYLHRPSLTAERFVPDPFGEPGSRLYRTGDLARWRDDGELEFLERMDRQVKVRGFRIEPGEIEARLVEHPDVLEAVVIARDDGPRGPQLVGYVVTVSRSPSDFELRRHLERHLPDHMLPAALVDLPRLPRTVNGKLDRPALPAPDWAANVSSAYAHPSTSTERVLANVWAQVLSLERVGLDDDFFHLGGHSLLAGEVVARAREALGRDIPIRLLFASPTVRGMATAIERGTESTRVTPIPRAARRRMDSAG